MSEKQKQYDYSLIGDEVRYHEKLSIVCHIKDFLGREHGIFMTNLNHIKRGDGCPKCNGKYMDKELFIAESKSIHGENTYNYEKFVFVDKRTKGIIHCNKHDIDYEQSPRKHLMGHGCPICRYEKSSSSKTHTNGWFLEKAKEIHGDKYDYSKTKYTKSGKKLEIICHQKDIFGEEHGSFWMTPENHLHKTFPQGCPKCARYRTENARRLTTEDFISKAKSVHGESYDYSKVEYINNSTKVCIICPKHGEFWMEPSNHLQGQRCPICNISHLEEDMRVFLKEKGIAFEKEKKFDWLKSKNHMRLDFYLPEYNAVIECQGLQHFEEVNFGGNKKSLSEVQERDRVKKKLCEEHDMKVFYYADYDYNFPYKVYEDKEEMLKEIKLRKINS